MAWITLKKFLVKDKKRYIGDVLSLVGEPVALFDEDGSLLYANRSTEGLEWGNRLPLRKDGQIAGWVAGEADSAGAALLAPLVEFILLQEGEKKDLAGEVLDKYRELHLLYRLSEELARSPQPAEIGQIALNEICPMVQADGGMAALYDLKTNQLQFVAECHCKYQISSAILQPTAALDRAIQTGTVQLLDDMVVAEFFEGVGEVPVSLLVAPLKTEKRIYGAIIVARDSDRPFAAGDIKLLNAVAMNAAPAIEIAHLHHLELERVRIEHDLKMAREVQLSLLPSSKPRLDGWQLSAFWQPARMVSGDLYDFLHFPDGKLGLVVADVTDKGVPAALVMANTRSILRGAVASSGSRGAASPGRLLSRVNQVLCQDMPMGLFVTCLLAVLDPASGRLRFTNAGHNLPFHRSARGAVELRATGLPLGIFPNAEYEEVDTFLAPGESLFMYSDGLVEAHNPQGAMFGTGRLAELLAPQQGGGLLEGDALIQRLMSELTAFTGPGWEQEDDVTLLTVSCLDV